MAKKKTSAKKKASKKVAKKAAKKPVQKTTKKTAKKAVAKKASKKVAKKATSKKTSKKVTQKSPKKAVAKKTATKKIMKKTAQKASSKKAAKKTTKKTTKKVAKKVTKKPAAKKAVAKKVVTKKAATKKVAKKAAKKKTKKKAAKKKFSAGAASRSVAAVAAAAEPDAAGYVIINGRRVRMISTKGFSPTKKKSSSSASTDQPVVPKVQPKKKTKMAKKELDFYRDLLLSERARLLGLVNGIEDEALRSKGGNLSNMPIHMADVGTDTFDQDLALGMAETERKLLNEINSALKRIQEKTYGVCDMTGKQIPKARLNAKPWARFTMPREKLKVVFIINEFR